MRIVERYRDAYAAAVRVTYASWIVQGLGWLVAAIVFFIGLGGNHGDFAVAALCTFAAAYVAAILIRALAHILRATLDNAVHSSPFLTNPDKAAAMDFDHGRKDLLRSAY